VWEKKRLKTLPQMSNRSGKAAMEHNVPAACRSVAILKTNLSNLKYTLYEK